MQQIYYVPICKNVVRPGIKRTNGHLVDSNSFEINEYGIKSKVLINVYCNIPKFYDSLNIVVIMQKMNQNVLL